MRRTTRPAVASLVPAVTDLMLAMNAGDHLAAVSNFDVEREGIRGLPRVGDYQSTDWERLSMLRPDVLFMDLAEDKVPAGFRKRAGDLSIRLVNVHIDRLEDIFRALREIGDVCGEPQKAAALEQKMRGQLDAVRRRVAGHEPVPSLIVLDESARGIVGPRNFLDDLLALAGGRNLAESMGKDYPSIDREQLLTLNPKAVLQLLPAASPQVLDQAKRSWEKVPELAAVKQSRVYMLSDWYVLLPASRVGDLAEQFAQRLHPQPDGTTDTHR